MGAAQVVLAATPLMLVDSLVTTMRVAGPHGHYFFLSVALGAGMIREGLSGLLAFNPSWRFMFLGCALVGLWMVAYGALALPRDEPGEAPTAGRFDWAGTALLSAIAGLAVFICYRGQYLGWFDSLPISLAILALPLALLLFAWRELVAPRPLLSPAHESLRIGMIPGLDPTAQVRRAVEEHAIKQGSSGPEATAQAVVTLDAWIQQNAVVMGYQTTLCWVAAFSLAALVAALAIPFTSGYGRGSDPGHSGAAERLDRALVPHARAPRSPVAHAGQHGHGS